MRCINIDWLEVFCSEGLLGPRDAEYFIRQGYDVEKRAYGTPQYRQMFTINEGGCPVLEVRRDPYSLKCQGGIFEPNDCHLRLSNRACYQPGIIDWLRRFMLAHGYEYKTLSRIDIALDFLKFDSGMLPNNLLMGYLRNKYSKLNQCNISAHGLECVGNVDLHGRDSWRNGRQWNSVKWGAATSAISTKLYNKSMEMRQVKRKFYIEDCWRRAGLWPKDLVLCDDTKGEFPDVWRVEFSIKSAIKGYASLSTGEYMPSSLSMYDAPDKLWTVFCILCSKYFDFRKVEIVNGVHKRKDRCTRLPLFDFLSNDVLAPQRLTSQIEPTRTDKILINHIKRMLDIGVPEPELIAAIRTLLSYLYRYKRVRDMELEELLENFQRGPLFANRGAVAPQLDFQLRSNKKNDSE